jgi:hypothetical protein
MPPIGTYFPSPDAGATARRQPHRNRTATTSKEGVDGNEKPDIIGGSLRRKDLRVARRSSIGNNVHFGEAALKKGVDEAEKPAIMGGSQRRKRRGTRRKALRPTPRFFDSMRRYLVKAPAGRMICPSCRRLIKQHINCFKASETLPAVKHLQL